MDALFWIFFFLLCVFLLVAMFGRAEVPERQSYRVPQELDKAGNCKTCGGNCGQCGSSH